MARRVAWASLACAAFAAAGYLVLAGAYEPTSASGESVEPVVLFDQADACEEPCHDAALSDTFEVDEGLGELHFVVYAVLDTSSGPAYVTVTDPSGDVRYERLFMNDLERNEAIQDAVTWSPEMGEWTLTRSYVGVSGHLDFQAWGEPLA